MERKDLSGIKFKSVGKKEYMILSGYENGEAVYEECGIPNAPLNFCCDAKLVEGRLKGSYCVSYTVSKEELFSTIDNLENRDTQKMTAALRQKYYKIPTVFLKLIIQSYLKERVIKNGNT